MKKNNFFSHETAVIDKECSIGDNTKIWHFTHIMPESIIGKIVILVKMLLSHQGYYWK